MLPYILRKDSSSLTRFLKTKIIFLARQRIRNKALFTSCNLSFAEIVISCQNKHVHHIVLLANLAFNV